MMFVNNDHGKCNYCGYKVLKVKLKWEIWKQSIDQFRGWDEMLRLSNNNQISNEISIVCN